LPSNSSKNTKKKLTLFALTWPIFIEILLHMLMGNADTLMLSQYSDNSVAAVGVSNQVISVVIVMFGFIATGTAIIVAQHLGADDEKQANEVATTSLSVNFLFAAVLSIVLFLFSEQILAVMGLPDELMAEALSYMKIVGGFAFIQALFMTASAIVRSHGFTKDTMYVTIGMNVLNVIGNYLFIFGPFGIPVLGVQGVAISTVVSRLLGFIVVLLILQKRVKGSLSIQALFSFPIHHIKNLLKIGIPSAGEHLSYNTSQMLITYYIATLGTVALTTKVYTQNIMMFIFLFAVAIGQGTQILIGHLAGAKQFEEAYNRCLKSLKIAIVITLSIAVIFYSLSDMLFSLFTSNREIIDVGKQLIFLTIILEPGRAFNLVVINSLRATGDVKFPVYMGIASMWGLSVPIAYFLGIYLGYGLVGVWIAFIVDEWFRGIIMLLRWRSRVWENKSFTSKQLELEK
jgi:putative MATE family efflux protein